MIDLIISIWPKCRQGAVGLPARLTYSAAICWPSKPLAIARDARRFANQLTSKSARPPVSAAKKRFDQLVSPERQKSWPMPTSAMSKHLESKTRSAASCAAMLSSTGKRIDGRDLSKTVRDPRSSSPKPRCMPRDPRLVALFTRGETQGLVVATLGTGDDEQFIDALRRQLQIQHFLLHYNFPPYSVGETGRMGSPGRREIGHGKLAWRATAGGSAAAKEDFPYTIRVVSEITESNGSSSMATVCGGSLAMMDAGVPLKRARLPVFAMGLIKEDDESYAMLSDILGDEDHLGDMDFKVAGTEKALPRCRWTSRSQASRQRSWKRPCQQAKDRPDAHPG